MHSIVAAPVAEAIKDEEHANEWRHVLADAEGGVAEAVIDLLALLADKRARN